MERDRAGSGGAESGGAECGGADWVEIEEGAEREDSGAASAARRAGAQWGERKCPLLPSERAEKRGQNRGDL